MFYSIKIESYYIFCYNVKSNGGMNMKKTDKRFISAHSENSFTSTSEILIDKETGVNYFFHANGTAGGLTVLLDRNGQPVVTTVFMGEV